MSEDWVVPGGQSPDDGEPADEAAPETAAAGPLAASRRPGWLRSTAVVGAALVAVGTGGGVLAGHALWGRSVAATPGSGAVTGGNGFGSGQQSFGNGGFGGPSGSEGFPGFGGSVGSGSSGSSSTATGPSDAAAIAKNVDPGLVDITTTLKYENAEAAGTGIVLTSDGEVLSNNHVIAGATSISVRDVGNNRTYRATVVGYDRSDDVAVLQLQDASGLTTVKTASSTPATGAAVVAIGNAGGSGGTPSYAGGSITATDQSITATDDSDGTSERLTGLLETDADVQAGDSGGPLVDTSGEVVGMDTAASSGFSFSRGGSDGYAIPIAKALSVASAIEAGQASDTVHIGTTAMLGVEVTSGSAAGSSGFNSGYGATVQGATIAGVLSGSPADAAGLVEGDVITSINGHSVDTADDLSSLLGTLRPGDSVTVGYTNRSGENRSASLRLTSGPPQ